MNNCLFFFTKYKKFKTNFTFDIVVQFSFVAITEKC